MKTYFVVMRLVLTLVVALVAVAKSAIGEDNYQAACQQADTRISAFERAVQSGDQAAITRAGLELQADPLAVRRLNATGSESIKIAHNDLTTQIKNSTMDTARGRIAQQYNVKPEQVTFYGATNPQKPGDPVKVGQDWDVTARVNGRDVPASVAGPVIHDSYYNAAGGKDTFGDRTPAQVAHQQAVEVTDYQHAEAYGGSKSEGSRIIEGPKDQRLRDPAQLSDVIKYKSEIAAQQAEALQGQGKGAEAEGWRVEEARQGVKQFDRQVQPRVEALGGEVPGQVKAGMDVLRDVERGTLTPEEARVKLQGMGETPSSINDKSAGLVEASQTLKPPSERGPAPQDVFVDNVKDRLDSTRAEQGRAPINYEEGLPKPESRGAAGVEQADGTVKVPEPLTQGRSSFQEPSVGDRIVNAAGEADSRIAGALGAGELPAGASGTRVAVNEVGATVVKGGGIVMAGLAVAETARESFQGGRAAGEGLQALAAGDVDKANQKFGEAADKGKNVGMIIGITAAAEAMPQTAALIGAGMAGYQGGRYVLNNTSAGQAVDKATLNTMDSGTRAAEALPDAIRNVLGIQTRDQRELTQRQETYLRALASGQLQLNDGVTIKDVMDQIKYGQPGTKEYQDRMNELISRNQNPDKKPGDIATQLNTLAAQITDPTLSRAEKDKAQLEYLQILGQIKNPKDKGERPGEGGEVAGGETNAPGTDVTGGDTNAPGEEVAGGGTNEPGTEVSGSETNTPGEEVVQGGASGPEAGESEVTSGETGGEPEGEGGEEEITPEDEATGAGATVFGGDGEEPGETGGESVGDLPPAEPSDNGGDLPPAEPSDNAGDLPPAPSDDGNLETSEAGYGETVDGSEPPAVDPNTSGGIQEFAQNNEQNLPGKDDYGLIQTASQGNQASTAGDGALLNANNVRNQGGADAQQTVNQGASETAQGDANDSWGNTLGNSLQQGLEQGLGQAGTALGAAGADAVSGQIFAPTNHGSSSGSGSSSDSSGTDQGESSAAGASTSGGGGGSGGSGGGGGGGAPPPPPPPPPSPPAGGGGGTPPGSGDSVVVTGSGSAGGGGGSSGASGSGSGGYAAGAQDQVLDASASLAGRTVTGVKVTLTYNAYGIPDNFQIVYGGAVIGSTGNISGGGTTTGNGSGSSPQVTIRVISNQSDQSTLWDWSASAEFFVAAASAAPAPSAPVGGLPAGSGAPVYSK